MPSRLSKPFKNDPSGPCTGLTHAPSPPLPPPRGPRMDNSWVGPTTPSSPPADFCTRPCVCDCACVSKPNPPLPSSRRKRGEPSKREADDDDEEEEAQPLVAAAAAAAGDRRRDGGACGRRRLEGRGWCGGWGWGRSGGGGGCGGGGGGAHAEAPQPRPRRAPVQLRARQAHQGSCSPREFHDSRRLPSSFFFLFFVWCLFDWLRLVWLLGSVVAPWIWIFFILCFGAGFGARAARFDA